MTILFTAVVLSIDTFIWIFICLSLDSPCNAKYTAWSDSQIDKIICLSFFPWAPCWHIQWLAIYSPDPPLIPRMSKSPSASLQIHANNKQRDKCLRNMNLFSETNVSSRFSMNWLRWFCLTTFGLPFKIRLNLLKTIWINK